MFNNSKYTKIYYQIVKKAKERTTINYTEKHHIIPCSLTGSNKKDNIVALTAREHFICHWLLTKMTADIARRKMIFALHMMRVKSKNHNNQRYETKITSRVYAQYKIEHAKNSSIMNKGKTPHNKGKKLEGIELEKQQERTRNRRKLTPEENVIRIAKMIATNTGRTRSEDTKLKMSLAHKGKLKGPMTDKNKAKISAGSIGKKKSKESSVKKANTLKYLASIGKHHTQIMLTCPHCAITVKKLNYARWHGNHCKLHILA